MPRLGGYPEQQQLYQQGRVDTPACPMCGEEEGTHQHVYYRCQHPACKQLRQALTSNKDGFADIVRLGATSKQRVYKWTRGLMATPCRPWGWVPPRWTLSSRRATPVSKGRWPQTAPCCMGGSRI